MYFEFFQELEIHPQSMQNLLFYIFTVFSLALISVPLLDLVTRFFFTGQQQRSTARQRAGFRRRRYLGV